MASSSLTFQAETLLPTEFGDFRFRVYKNTDNQEVVAITTRDIEDRQGVPVRLHSACFTAEVMGSLKCDCKQQLDYALSYIAEHGGVIIYLPQEGRGIGLSNKIRAYALQEDGHDTVDANHLLDLPVDSRCYDDAAFILQDLNIYKLRLITNNPSKLAAMKHFGFTIQERIQIPAVTNRYSHGYIEAKRARLGHILDTPIFNDRLNPKHQAAGINRPVVHINFAIDRNGRMNRYNGQAINLSCSKDWQRVHELRERYSAVAVGAKTWRLDAPRLTARHDRLGRAPQRQPDRVIFAGRSQCLIQTDCRRSFVVGSARGVVSECIHIAASDRNLRIPLENLFKHGVETLLVEGGMTLLRSFIDQNMVDRLTVYVSTPSRDQAISSLSKTFPTLPATDMNSVPLGKGILFSYAPKATRNNNISNAAFPNCIVSAI